MHCPHCQGTNINKNGIKSTGKQNFLCRNCKKQFQCEYKNQGSNPVIKSLVEKSLCRNSGIRDIENIFNVSKACILNILISYAKNIEIQPQKSHYKSLQIADCRPDEFWTYVGSKGNKMWLLYAYSPENKRGA